MGAKWGWGGGGLIRVGLDCEREQAVSNAEMLQVLQMILQKNVLVLIRENQLYWIFNGL